MGSSRGKVTPKATCDICGREREARDGVFATVAGRRVCNWHPHFMPVEKLDAMPYITFQAGPIKDPRPFDPRPTHQLGEDELGRFLALTYQYGTVNASSSPDDGASPGARSTPGYTPALATTSAWSAAWTAIYLHALIIENRRPVSMLAAAKAQLRIVADWLVSHQEAGPAITTGMGRLVNDSIPNNSGQPEWGGYIHDTGIPIPAGGLAGSTSPKGYYSPLSAGAAGIALLRAFQVLGDGIYADAARACAWHCRTLQCGDMVVRPSSSDSAGANKVHWGTWDSTLVFHGTNLTYSMDHVYRPQALICARFLALYISVIGDEVIGSTAVSVTDPTGAAYPWPGSRAALASACLAEARAFWSTAIADATRGAPILGLSTETPAEAFDSFPANKFPFVAGAGSWVWSNGFTSSSATITAQNWALAVWALYEMDGGTTQVTGIFDWLMSFASDPSFELPATTPNRMVSGYDDRFLLAGVAGPYDPKFALATLLNVRSGTLALSGWGNYKNGSSLYDLSTTGLLAPLYSARQQAPFKEFKDALDLPRRLSLQSGRAFYLATIGQCGLSLQPHISASITGGVIKTPARAAMAGLVYRQQPQAFLGRGH